MKRAISLLCALALLLSAAAAAAEETLMPVTSALGYSLTYDTTSFTLDSRDGTGDTYWWTATYGDERFPATYLCLSAQPMSAAKLAKSLLGQSGDEPTETEREVAGEVCPVIVCDSDADGNAYTAFVCIPTGDTTSLQVEMRCFEGGQEDIGARMWQVVSTLRLEPLE